ncbi:SusC/RagA family TonB-linked outer membrane protein [Bacteroidia bacterium]|nr:SusC/RagA family TonB-linked outer membrane protein [Bacteroidia bacterium]
MPTRQTEEAITKTQTQIEMKRILLIICVLIWSISSQAQNTKQNNLTYSGTVVDQDDNSPLIGAQLLVEGTLTGTTTDAKGNFSISAPPNATFLISFMGYNQRQMKMAPGSPTTIKLTSSAKTIDDVVVIGYGTARASELTVASSGIRSGDMVTEGNTSFEQGLQGKLSGVVVLNTEGAPGSAISMEIRGVSTITGSTEPLYVIDGLPVENDDNLTATQEGKASTQSLNPMASLNPSDIENIVVLKDAAATSIYGSRGANGVVLITTKSGKIGKAQASVIANYGVSQVMKKLDVLGPHEYAEWRMWATNNPKWKSEEELVALDDNPHRWQDRVYRLGTTREIGANISGGTRQMNYMISGNYFNQQGIVVNSGFERYSFRANLGAELSPSIKMSSRSNFTRGIYNSISSSSRAADINQQGIIKQILRFNPAQDDEDDPNYDISDDEDLRRNPYVDATSPTRLTFNDRVTSILTFDFRLAKNLVFKPSAGIDYTVSRAETYYPRNTYQGKQSAGLEDPGMAGLGFVQTMKWSSENQLTYSNTFRKKHALTAMAVVSLEDRQRRNLKATSRGFLNDLLINNAMQNGLASTYTVNSDRVRQALMSYTGRVNYNYDKRYMFTGSVRFDGSTSFGANNRWAVFPAGSFAWNAVNEKFFKSAFHRAQVSNLRMRLSWGLVGNQSIPPNQSKDTYVAGNYPSSGIIMNAVLPTRLANPNLKWETTEQTNLGLDMGFFKERLTLNFNAYYKETRDLLQSIVVPSSTGFTEQYQNSGSIMNKGLEFELTGVPVREKKFQWQISANISFNRNKVLSLGDDINFRLMENLGSGGSVNYSVFAQTVGQPVGIIWGYKTDGVYQRPPDYLPVYDPLSGERLSGITESDPHGLADGDTGSVRDDKMLGEIIYVDLNGDGVINDDDRTAIGNVNPKFNYGITNTFTYGRFDLTLLVVGVYGNDIYNQVFTDLESLSGGTGNQLRGAFYSAWMGEGTGNYYPKLAKAARKYYCTDHAVEDGSFARVKTVRLTFNFDGKLIKLPKFPRGSLYFNINNALIFTRYRGYDPEVSSFGHSAARRGIDMGAYPQSRTFSFGITLNL